MPNSDDYRFRMERCYACGRRGALVVETQKRAIDDAGDHVVDCTVYTCPDCGERYVGFDNVESLLAQYDEESD